MADTNNNVPVEGEEVLMQVFGGQSLLAKYHVDEEGNSVLTLLKDQPVTKLAKESRAFLKTAISQGQVKAGDDLLFLKVGQHTKLVFDITLSNVNAPKRGGKNETDEKGEPIDDPDETGGATEDDGL